MNLDELRTVQSKERSKDSLQHLRESFYADVADYVADLRERRDRAAERADRPLDDPEVRRLTDEIQTAEDVVEGIYERRVGKVVKRASLAAMGVAADSEGLTAEERELFEELVDRIETNKQSVLDVLAGDESSPAIDTSPTPENAAPTSSETGTADASADADVSAADVMGGESAGATPASSAASDSAESDAADDRPGAEASAVVGGETPPGSASGDGDAADSADAGDSTDEDADSLAGLDERTTVRVTDDVGEIFGVDERTYDLASEDVVTLPEANAEPLLERGAAEKLE